MVKAPEIQEIETKAAEANVSIADVLKRAGVASTTWWRWSEGQFDPRFSTLRKVRDALDEEIAARDAGDNEAQGAAA
jgi:predicted transcriptional regulator